MYENRKEPTFDAPVPGTGMTHEVGARPWQQPAQYTKIDEVAQLYVAQMQDEVFMENTLNLLETKMPVTMIANALQTANVMNGVHSIDVGVLSLPIIMEMIMLIADTEGIEYVTGTERNIEAELQDSSIQAAIQQVEDETRMAREEEPIQEEEQVEMENMSTGLMARRS
jgi:hypothetical protein|tara:strand:- start:1088 stop:1594 length:507 start_codon:yes stop_codon:yes gene_type:complete